MLRIEYRNARRHGLYLFTALSSPPEALVVFPQFPPTDPHRNSCACLDDDEISYEFESFKRVRRRYQTLERLSYGYVEVLKTPHLDGGGSSFG
jgi:hypothetical protein